MNLIAQETRLGDNTTREIALTQGKFMIVSASLFDHMNQWKWQAHLRKTKHKKYWYARRSVVLDGVQINILAHVYIAQPPEGWVVDHIDGNGLNNVDENLRSCLQQNNSRNRRMNGNNTSGWPNVFRIREAWYAQVACSGRKYFKRFSKLLEAIAWAEKVKQELFGEFYHKPDIPMPEEPDPYTHVRKMHKNNKSGHTRIRWEESHKAWAVSGHKNGKKARIGRRKTLTEAINLRDSTS